MLLNKYEIFEEFEKFNTLNRKAIAESIILKDYYTIAWEINSVCNFNCPYCINPSEQSPDSSDYSVNEIKSAFNKTKKNWIICFTGGEPFLFPNFTDLLSELSHKHYFDINTNLSTDNIYNLPNIKNPSSILSVYASYHVIEREKQINGIRDFIDKVLFLQQQNIHTIVSYLAYPSLMPRIKDDIDFLLNQGIKNIAPKRFIGTFQGKIYPESYSEGDITFMKSLKNCFELDLVNFDQNTIGRPCLAGKKYFFMNRHGELFRCSSILSPHGNFFEQTISYDFFSKKCTSKNCSCPFEGVFLSKSK